jgi:hypothetical protein
MHIVSGFFKRMTVVTTHIIPRGYVLRKFILVISALMWLKVLLPFPVGV